MENQTNRNEQIQKYSTQTLLLICTARTCCLYSLLVFVTCDSSSFQCFFTNLYLVFISVSQSL